jgi:Fe-Mn family superoxide dismutase
MNKRDFIKTGLLGIASFATLGIRAKASVKSSVSGFVIPNLPYQISDISGLFSKNAFHLHYSRYLSANYKLNEQLNKVVFTPSLVKDILSEPEQYNQKVISSACDYYNHKLFFKQINPHKKGTPTKGLSYLIKSNFNSPNELKQEIIKTSTLYSNAEWIWLYMMSNGQLALGISKENENPLLNIASNNHKGFPLMGFDVCAHAFSLDYASREEYINTLFDHTNWNYINNRYNRALKHFS